MITAATGIGGFLFTALTGFMADQWGMQAAMAALSSFFIISLLAALAVIKASKGTKSE
jgi:nitrate/nitrite transporter NarK